jgi:hypothetical protein
MSLIPESELGLRNAWIFTVPFAIAYFLLSLVS